MKDLYRRLGLDKNASAEEIAAALEAKQQLSEYAPVLLDEKKRAGYDRTHSTLNTIGALRHRLGLDSGETWFLERYADFAPKNILAEKAARPATPAAESTAPVNPGKIPEQAPPSAAPAHANHSVIIIAVVVIAILALVAFTLL